MGYFSQEILIHCYWHQEVLLSHLFAVLEGEIILWRGTSCLQTLMSENLAFDFGRNTFALREFIGHLDLTNFCKISPKHSKNNNEGKCVGKFNHLKCFSCGIHLYNMPHIILATPTLDADI